MEYIKPGFQRGKYSQSRIVSSNMKTSIMVLVLGAIMAAAMAAPPPPEKKYDGYFQYANVPGEKEYEFGFNRGNAAHYASRYEQSKDHRFRTKVKWADAQDGYGEHYWEYNHGDGNAAAYPAPAYSPPAYTAPAYSEPVASYQPAPQKYKGRN